MTQTKENAQEKIAQIQLLEQNMQSILVQKQSFQSQLSEVETALSEVESSKKSYKLIGNFMFVVDKEKIVLDLKEKQEMLHVRLAAMEKQEQKLKERAKELQKEVMEEMKK